MSVPIGFRCPELLVKEIERYRKDVGLSRTDALLALIEKGLSPPEPLEQINQVSLQKTLDSLIKISTQALCILNQLGELAGDDVMSDAEQEFLSLMEKLKGNL